jgi:hypothetical protein
VKLRIIIDGLPHEIDSTDPDLLARWIVEIFGRIPQIYPSTLIEVQARPSWVNDGSIERPNWVPDWAADARVIGQVQRIRSPRELLAALAVQLDEAEALK